MTIFIGKDQFHNFFGTCANMDKFKEIYEKSKISLSESTKFDCDISGNSDLYFLLIPRLEEACITLGYEAFIDADNGVMAVIDTSKLQNEAVFKDQIKDIVLEVIRKHGRKRKWSVWSNHRLSDGKRRKYGTHKSKVKAKLHDKMAKLGGG